MDFTATRDSVSNKEMGNEWWAHNTIHWLNVTVSRRTQGPQPSTSKPQTDWALTVIDAASPHLHPCPYLQQPKGKQFLGGTKDPIFDAYGRQLPHVETWEDGHNTGRDQEGTILSPGGGRGGCVAVTPRCPN